MKGLHAHTHTHTHTHIHRSICRVLRGSSSERRQRRWRKFSKVSATVHVRCRGRAQSTFLNLCLVPTALALLVRLDNTRNLSWR